VKKAVVLFLMSLYLLGATEAYQLLKLPFLFAHYKTHQQIDKGICFSRFIEMHYFDNTKYDNDYQEDMRLPFKTSNRIINLLSFETLFGPKPIAIAFHFSESNKAYRYFDAKKHDSNNLKNIFQPPRV
jgi:hypothetical protein